MPKRLLFAIVFFALNLLMGCAPKWTVIQQASPNPFIGKGDFAVVPVDFDGLMVGEKTEAEYLAGKSAEQGEKFQGDKRAIDERFLAELKDEAQDEGLKIERAAGENKAKFIVKPLVQFIEPGFYAVVASAPSEVRMRVTIESADGTVLDIIELSHQTDSKSSGVSIGGISTNPSSGGRIREDAEWLGEAVAEYLLSRVKPEQ